MQKNVLSRGAIRFALTGLSVMVVTACATVSPEDMESELSQLRAEMQEREERVDQLENRIGEVEQQAEQRMNELEQNLSGIQEEFGGEIESMEQAIRFSAPVYFEFDESTLRDQDRGLLDRFVEVVSQFYPDATITVEGFADPTGDPDYNIWLGQQRADTVQEYLVSGGLAENQVRAVSYGGQSERLIVPAAGGPESGWQNRRVVLVIDHSEAVQEQMQESASLR